MTRLHQWTEEEIEKMRSMYKDGYSYSDIADALNMSYYAAASRIREELNRGILIRRPHGSALGRYWQDRKEEAEKTAKRTGKTRSKEFCIAQFVARYSLCWLCRRACIECVKPVNGFDARGTPHYNALTGEYTGSSYYVYSCPKFEEEPYVDKYVKKNETLLEV